MNKAVAVMAVGLALGAVSAVSAVDSLVLKKSINRLTETSEYQYRGPGAALTCFSTPLMRRSASV
ncbi:hypothetical protein R80B4_03077 [Fibrobacteres bacterium R8-0-B4]